MRWPNGVPPLESILQLKYGELTECSGATGLSKEAGIHLYLCATLWQGGVKCTLLSERLRLSEKEEEVSISPDRDTYKVCPLITNGRKSLPELAGCLPKDDAAIDINSR